MWNFTATAVHGTVLHYSAPTREAARIKRTALNRTPFIVSTTTPAKAL